MFHVTADVSLQVLSQLSFFVTADVLDRGGQRASFSLFFNASDLSTFVWPLATPRCEAALWDLVMHTRKGNVVRATSGACSVGGGAAGASISTAGSGTEITGA